MNNRKIELKSWWWPRKIWQMTPWWMRIRGCWYCRLNLLFLIFFFDPGFTALECRRTGKKMLGYCLLPLIFRYLCQILMSLLKNILFKSLPLCCFRCYFHESPQLPLKYENALRYLFDLAIQALRKSST